MVDGDGVVIIDGVLFGLGVGVVDDDCGGFGWLFGVFEVFGGVGEDCG